MQRAMVSLRQLHETEKGIHKMLREAGTNTLHVAQRTCETAKLLAAQFPLTPDGIRNLYCELATLAQEPMVVLARTHLPIACGPGCSYCCEQGVSALPVEVALIYSSAPASALDEAVRLATVLKTPKNNAQARAKLACPLLNAERECSVYAVRPLACHAEHSYSVRACMQGFGAGHPMAPQPWLLTNAVQLGITQHFGSLGLDTALVDLAFGLAALRRGALAAEEPLRRWLAGERLFSTAASD